MVAIFTIAVMVPLVVVLGAVSAGAATATIASAGPLTAVGISDQLNCSVNHTGDTAGEFFGDTACGTFIVVDGTGYFSPASIPAGQPSITPFTPVSQTGPTGSGTDADPYKIVTVVAAGDTGVGVTQTDTYTTGLESYRTDIQVTNSSGTSKAVRVYRAADCYLQSSDSGYGAVDATTGAVACTTGLDPGSRIEQWFPLTAGSRYMEDGYSTVWSQITSLQPFPNTCVCNTLLDNGAGLSWDVNVAAAGSSTVSSLITFSPLGRLPLSLAKTADAGSVGAGASDGYTITATNPNAVAVPLDTLTDALPAGFSYVPGSTTGATTANPSVAGQDLTWSGISVPGAGSASVHFSVTATSTPGTYTNEATGTSADYTVAPTGPTAPVTVTASANPLVINLTPASATNPVGTPHTVTATATRNGAAQAGVAVSFSVTSGPNFGSSGSATTDATGQATFTYTGGPTAGTDTIQASALDGATTVLSNSVTKTWTSVALPLVLSLTPDTATNPVGTNHTVTALASRGGVAQAGVAVSFAVVSGPNTGPLGTSTTDGSGNAGFTYSSAIAGTDTIRASAPDGATTVSSNDVTKTWTAASGAALSVTSTSEPPVVTVGGQVLNTVTATNTGTAPATGVDVTLTLPSSSTLTSITPSQGTCDPPAAATVTCHLGTINGGGGAATIRAVIMVPGAVPDGGTITTMAVGSSDQTGPTPPADADTTIAPQVPGQAQGFVPPGGTLSTGTTATPADNTIISFTLPNTGPGAPISLLAENDSTLSFCGGQRCSGKTAFVSPFAGYEDPMNPAKVAITWDRTVAGRGLFSKLYVQKADGGPIVVVPDCAPRPRFDRHHHEYRGWWSWWLWFLHRDSLLGPHSGVADPSPCVDARSVDRHGDVRFEILLLSGDPKFGRR